MSAGGVERALATAAETDAVGAALGRALGPGDVVLLSGPLGAGKSALARAAIQARLADIGAAEEAPSPSYTLVQTYDLGAVEFRHADLYRLSDPEEIDELGLLDALEGAVALIEWGERLGTMAPARRLEIRLDPPPGDAGRLLRATAHGPGWNAALAALGAPAERRER